MCDHHLWDDPNGIRCTREDCDGRGHVYKPASGLSDEATEDQ
jgi:hypothetical protein